MIKKTIDYKNFFDEPKTKDLYFNVSTAELVELELETPGGFGAKLQKMIEDEDGRDLVRMIREIIMLSYGERDGSEFVKSEGACQRFISSGAYDALFKEFANEPTKFIDFVNGVMPADLDEQVAKMTTAQLPEPAPEAENKEEPAWIKEDRDPTQIELRTMSQAELRQAAARKLERRRLISELSPE